MRKREVHIGRSLMMTTDGGIETQERCSLLDTKVCTGQKTVTKRWDREENPIVLQTRVILW